MRFVAFFLLSVLSLGADSLYQRFLSPFQADRNQTLQHMGFGIDNDFLTVKNRDRYYTHGNRATYAITRYGDENALDRSRISLVQKIFTPQDLDRHADELTSEDRLYAGLLALEIGQTHVAKKDQHAHSLDQKLTIGCLGKCAYSGEVQTEVHEWMIDHGFEETVLPRGWEGQIKEQLVLNYHYRWNPRQYTYHTLVPWADVLLRPYAGFDAGNLALDGFLGVEAQLIKDTHTSGYLAAQPGSLPRLFGREYSLEADFQILSRAYDATLQGNIFERQEPYDGLLSPMAVRFGVTFYVRMDSHLIRFAQRWHTPEMKGQDMRLNYHAYGSLEYGYLW